MAIQTMWAPQNCRCLVWTSTEETPDAEPVPVRLAPCPEHQSVLFTQGNAATYAALLSEGISASLCAEFFGDRIVSLQWDPGAPRTLQVTVTAGEPIPTVPANTVITYLP